MNSLQWAVTVGRAYWFKVSGSRFKVNCPVERSRDLIQKQAFGSRFAELIRMWIVISNDRREEKPKMYQRFMNTRKIKIL